jgi:uncharacterized protein (TIGR03000 family)
MRPKNRVAAVIAIALLLLSIDVKAYGQAASGHSGIGGAYSRGGLGAGAYGFNTGSNGFYGGGLFYGDYLTGGGYPGYFAPFAYPNPGISYSYPDPYYSRSIGQHLPAAKPPIIASPATIHVVLPDPKATVVFDGHKTTSTGKERFFYTPDLPRGAYEYQLRVTWMQDGKSVTQERTIIAIPGETTEIAFTTVAK